MYFGYVIASSISQPLRSLARTCGKFSLHSVSVMISRAVLKMPRYIHCLLSRRLFPWSSRVAQQQLSLLYPLLFSIRSMVFSGLGLGPISRKNVSNEDHSSHTVIPRPPYLAYTSGFRSLVQRSIMSRHIRISALPFMPCVVFSSRRKHPHDFAEPVVRLVAGMAFLVPQSHRQDQYVPRRLSGVVARSATTNRPNRLPLRSCMVALLRGFSVKVQQSFSMNYAKYIVKDYPAIGGGF